MRVVARYHPLNSYLDLAKHFAPIERMTYMEGLDRVSDGMLLRIDAQRGLTRRGSRVAGGGMRTRQQRCEGQCPMMPGVGAWGRAALCGTVVTGLAVVFASASDVRRQLPLEGNDPARGRVLHVQ